MYTLVSFNIIDINDVQISIEMIKKPNDESYSMILISKTLETQILRCKDKN